MVALPKALLARALCEVLEASNYISLHSSRTVVRPQSSRVTPKPQTAGSDTPRTAAEMWRLRLLHCNFCLDDHSGPLMLHHWPRPPRPPEVLRFVAQPRDHLAERGRPCGPASDYRPATDFGLAPFRPAFATNAINARDPVADDPTRWGCTYASQPPLQVIDLAVERRFGCWQCSQRCDGALGKGNSVQCYPIAHVFIVRDPLTPFGLIRVGGFQVGGNRFGGEVG